MTYHNKEKQEVLQELNVQESTGLSSSEVKKRREQYGENRLRAKKSKSNWERFAEQFKRCNDSDITCSSGNFFCGSMCGR
mgnify:CR=1 FL=1